MTKYDVFISYSRFDKAIVHSVSDRLQNEGFKVWIDRDGIESGDAFKRNIVKAIENSSVVIFFSSKDSNASEWTIKEIGVAVLNKIPIIPIVLDDAPYDSEILLDLVNLDKIDFQNDNTEYGYTRLVKSLKSKCPAKEEFNATATTDTLEPAEKNDQTDQIEGSKDDHVDIENGVSTSKRPLHTPKILKSDYVVGIILLVMLIIAGATYFVLKSKTEPEDPIFPDSFYIGKTAEVLYNTAELYYSKNQKREAIELYEAAADSGFVLAQLKLGNIYTLDNKYNNAAKWYQKAADNGDVYAMNILADWHLEGKVDGIIDLNKTVQLYTQSANLGSGDAAYELGRMYLDGNGVTQDQKLALKWLTKADSLGYSLAILTLARRYRSGKGFDKNIDEALRLYNIAAERDSCHDAFMELGEMYYYGEGVKQDTTMATAFFQNGIAIHGFPEYAYYYDPEPSYSYRSNDLDYKGTDPKLALVLYKIGATHGHIVSIRKIGEFYEKGIGVPKDTIEALRWYRIAADRDDSESIDRIEELGKRP